VKRVLVADGLQAVGVDALRKHGLEVEVVGSLASASSSSASASTKASSSAAPPR